MELFKIRVKNLGRIKDAKLSIHPLTVFCGPNNTNKTWLANAIYGLARRLQLPVPGWVDHSDPDPSIEAVLKAALIATGSISSAMGITTRTPRRKIDEYGLDEPLHEALRSREFLGGRESRAGEDAL